MIPEQEDKLFIKAVLVTSILGGTIGDVVIYFITKWW
jgi:membrane protein DedA with SNARE-associated domain